MSKPERGSLSVVKRALPNLPTAAPPKELESRLLGPEEPVADSAGAAGTAVAQAKEALDAMDVQQPDVHVMDVQPATVSSSPEPEPAPVPATRLSPRPGKRKEPVQMVTYRIPASLYDRLFRTAEYNNLNMTDIVVEAIERHLPNFPAPRG